MIKSIDEDRYFYVTGKSSDEVQTSLDRAVELAHLRALAGGWEGVLITRHEPAVFTVAVSPQVPFGVTCEREG